MIVVIDGPAGAGKSTVARQLASRLGFRYLDTGAMYRAVALAAVRRGVDVHDSDALAHVARESDIVIEGQTIRLDGDDVSEQIRTQEITRVTRFAADCAQVREHLGQLQRQAAAQKNIVTEGRDQGTAVFPDAECKIFLTASPEERAGRRQRELGDRGESVSLDEVLDQINRRDRQDFERPVGPLVQAEDAAKFRTDGLTIDEVVDALEKLVRSRWQT